MADDIQSNSSHRSRKFHEGWLQIKEKGHVGTLYLDGQTEVRSNKGKQSFGKAWYKFDLYTNNPVRKCNQFRFDKENSRDVWKCFIMGVSTGLVHILPGQLKDVVEAIGEGLVPRDVHILPGQLKDVVEAIGEVQRTPPPLPTLPRPRIRPQGTSERSYGSNGSEESDASGSFGTHITQQPAKSNRSKSVPRLDLQEDVPNLRTLYRRQSELALKTLGGRGERGRSPGPRGGGGGRDSSDGEDYGSESSSPWSEFSLGSPPPKSVRGHNEGTFAELEELEWGGESLISGLSGGGGRATSPLPLPPPQSNGYRGERPTSPTTHMMAMSGRPSSPLPPPPPPASYQGGRQRNIHPPPPGRQNSDYGSSHGEVVHMFYLESGRNREHPPWFFENTSREVAESVLTLGKRYGNVLMRESVTFKNTGSYVISMRREVAGGTQLNHYEVQKTQHGFKINVDNDHRPMRCLNDVMEFFVRQAGPGSSPLRTNNLSKLGLNVATTGRRGPVDDAPDSGVEDDDVRSNSSQPHMSTTMHRMDRTAQRPPHMGKMVVSGNVPSEMQQTANEIEYTMKKSTPKWDESRMSIPPAPPPPPPPGGLGGGPPPPPPHPDYNTGRYGDHDARSRGAGPPPEGGFSDPNLNRTVPPRLPPTETLQRAAGHPDVYYNSPRGGLRRQSSSETDYRHDPFDSQPSPGLPPPPPPMMSMGAPPPPPMMGMGSAPPPPMMGMGSPPPPPAPPADHSSPPPPPAAGSLQAMLAGASPLQPVSAGRRMSDTSSQVSGSSTTPSRPRGGMGGGGGALSFEDELKKRLVAQREDVYASGATVLKSNWKEY